MIKAEAFIDGDDIWINCDLIQRDDGKWWWFGDKNQHQEFETIEEAVEHCQKQDNPDIQDALKALNSKTLETVLTHCQQLIEQASGGELTVLTFRKDDVERAKLGYVND
jgi:hypothetical protein